MMADRAPNSADSRFPRGVDTEPHSTLPCFLAGALCFATLLAIGFFREGDAVELLMGRDDFMRMVQVLDWIDGQGWKDVVQRRLDPPAGVAMHWSRLADIPAASVILLAEAWVGRAAALHLSVLLVPSLLGGLLAAAFLWIAASLTPDRRTPLPILMVGTLFFPLVQMQPGRVDHHGLQLVLTALAIGILVSLLKAGRPRAAVGLGIAGGTSLAIGLEALPFLGVVTVILSLGWGLCRRVPAMALAAFGASLTGTSLVFLLSTLPRTEWTTIVCDRMSLAHVAVAAVVLMTGAAALAIERSKPTAGCGLRLVTLCGFGIGGLALAALAFPQCAGSPYANVPVEIHYWLTDVGEARSLVDVFHWKPGIAVSVIVLPLAALVSVAWQWSHSSDRGDPRWIALFVLVLSGIALVVWQVRGASYAGLVAGIALLPLAIGMNERARRSKTALTRAGQRICIPMTCFLAIILPTFLESAPDRYGERWSSGCDVRSLLAPLTDPAGLGAGAQLIAAPIDVGPSLLFLTHHEVLAAPYHRNVRGLSDYRLIFAGSEEQAVETMRARGVDAVLFCRTEIASASAFADRPPFLNARLASGDPPWWLIPLFRDDDMGLYRVHPDLHAIP